MFVKTDALEDALAKAGGLEDVTEEAMYYKDSVIPAMAALRADADALETITAKKYWPYPSYGDLLFGVK